MAPDTLVELYPLQISTVPVLGCIFSSETYTVYRPSCLIFNLDFQNLLSTMRDTDCPCSCARTRHTKHSLSSRPQLVQFFVWRFSGLDAASRWFWMQMLCSLQSRLEVVLNPKWPRRSHSSCHLVLWINNSSNPINEHHIKDRFQGGTKNLDQVFVVNLILESVWCTSC